jgi:hypothetical protein
VSVDYVVVDEVHGLVDFVEDWLLDGENADIDAWPWWREEDGVTMDPQHGLIVRMFQVVPLTVRAGRAVLTEWVDLGGHLPEEVVADLRDRCAAWSWHIRLEQVANSGGDPDIELVKEGCCWVIRTAPGADLLTVQPEPGGGYADRGIAVVSAEICSMTDPAEALLALEELRRDMNTR